MFLVLQLSDLHRSASDPVGNAELIAALESDRRRWPPEVAHGPDIIVISGDLVQGVGLGASDHKAQLDQQYADAAAFLEALVHRFLGSDRSRLVLVPGNHDVDWCTAREAMEAVNDEELERIAPGLPHTVLDPASSYRWSWSEQKLYRVADPAAYAARLDRFLEFRRQFYSGLDQDPLRWDKDLLFMEYPGHEVSVTGLSSWFGNDCYCQVGAFDVEKLAVARDAIAASPCELHIAVWHHGTAGPPSGTDFLDMGQVQRLIDYGYRVGLHGHHHRTDAVVMSLKLPTEEEFALVSAGSLAAGRRELPSGVNRQYSLLEIEPGQRSVRVHVREAIGDLVFAESKRTELGGNSYIDLTWTATPSLGLSNAAMTRAIDEAYRAFAVSDLMGARRILDQISDLGGAERRLLIDVLVGLDAWGEIPQAIGEPRTQDELMVLVTAFCRLALPQEARKALEAHADAVGLGEDLREQLEARIAMTESGT